MKEWKNGWHLTNFQNDNARKVSIFGVFLVRMWENADQKNSRNGHSSV